MRKTALISVAIAFAAAGAVTVAAAGGGHGGAATMSGASARTAAAGSVHYTVRVTLRKEQTPLTLNINGGASRDRLAVRLRLGDLKLKDGTALAGTDGAVMVSKPFLYERAPGGTSALGSVRWLRLHLSDLPPRSQAMSTLRSLTPSPLLRVVGEARLRTVGVDRFAGTVAYDDPIVRTALHALSGGLEFRGLKLFVRLGGDGRIHLLRLTGRTADGRTTLAVRARLYGFGTPVRVVPPKPGTFVDRSLALLQS